MPRVSSSVDVKRIGWPQIYLGVGFTALATLVLELSLTRIFSVVFFYRFSVLAISIALCGLAAGGVFSYLVAARKGNLFIKLGALAALNSFAVVLSLVFILTRRGEIGNVTMALICFTAAVPFFLSGTIVSLVVAETMQRIDRIYSFQLLGAASGCLAIVPFLSFLGGSNTVLTAAVLFGVSSAIWFHCAGSPAGRAAAVVLALVLVALIAYNGRSHHIDVHYAKGRDLPPEIFSKWNSFSRVGLTAAKTLTIDADPLPDILQSDSDQAPSLSLPYLLRPGSKTLVIGQGGWGVARALSSGSKDVTVVEINPIIANTIMRGTYAGLSERIYLRPEVHVQVEHGRTFIRRSTEKYQVILVDQSSAPSALSANYLYTTDAIRDYLTHLSDDGLLALQPPNESPGLLSLAQVAFQEIRERDLASHVVVLRADGQDTVMIFCKPISEEDRAKILGAVKPGLVYAPGLTGSDFAQLPRGSGVSPVSDDRPFFFYSALAVPLLFGLVGIGILVTAATLWLPPLLFKPRLPIEEGLRSFICYFLCLGAGSMLIQATLIQKFILLLGHPTSALPIVLFSMSIAIALGSIYSGRIIASSPSRWTLILTGIATLAAMLAFVASPIAVLAAGLPTPARTLITVLSMAPLGFLMGVPFPAGLRRLEARYPEAVRWAWSVNAASVVLGSALAIFLSIYLGLRMSLVAGGGLYLVALLIARTELRQSAPITTSEPAALITG